MSFWTKWDRHEVMFKKMTILVFSRLIIVTHQHRHKTMGFHCDVKNKTYVCFVLNIFIHLPNSLKLNIASRFVRNYNLNTYK